MLVAPEGNQQILYTYSFRPFGPAASCKTPKFHKDCSLRTTAPPFV